MALCLLLSKDASLQSGIEQGLSRLRPPPTLLTLDHDQGLDDVLDSLSEVKLLMIDLRHFGPPSPQEIPVLLLDGDSSPPVPHPHPCILLPIRPAEITSWVHYLLNHAEGTGVSGGRDTLSFFLRVQREVLHDLNNQQTTLQGHLPLLSDVCQGEEKEILSDICTAAEQAGRLLKMLEVMNPDATCAPNAVQLTPFLKKLSSLSRRILTSTTQADFQFPDVEISILADEALLSLCLLNALDELSSPQGSCTLDTRQEGDHLQLRIQSPPSTKEVEASLLTQINQRLHPIGARAMRTEEGLVFLLKIAHSSPTTA